MASRVWMTEGHSGHSLGRVNIGRRPGSEDVIVDNLPMTASGKIQKCKLRENDGELWPEAMA